MIAADGAVQSTSRTRRLSKKREARALDAIAKVIELRKMGSKWTFELSCLCRFVQGLAKSVREHMTI